MSEGGRWRGGGEGLGREADRRSVTWEKCDGLCVASTESSFHTR